MRGRPHFLFAQAMPSVAMQATLADDPDFRRVTALWQRAKVALVGIGAPPMRRESISTAIPLDDESLGTALGDICLNFFDPDGREIEFPGSDRLVRTSPEQLRRIPRTIAVAVGQEKVYSMIARSRAGLFNRPVTDVPTAERLQAALDRDDRF